MSQTAKNEERNLKINDFAPDFTAMTDGGKEFTLSTLRNKKNAVIYFYPKDDTPGCTIEAKDFNSDLKEFKNLKTEIIGISRDDVESHDKFKAKYCLEFPLVSDETGTITEAYGVWVEKSMYGKKYMGIERTTFLVDKNGKIKKIWPKVKVENHSKEVLEAVKDISEQ